MIAIPTTAGTGSEVTLWSVFTDDARAVKVAIGSTLIYPAVALWDPELTLDLPPMLTAATGMDALAHAVECYTNNACQPISGSLALQAIELLGRHLRSAVLTGRNLQSRYAIMLAATMAGVAMNPTRLGIAHALAMPLGSWDLRIPHGVVLAVTLPAVMEFNYVAEPERFIDVARALGEKVDHLSRLEGAAQSVAAVRSLARDIGIDKRLSEFGLREEHVHPVVTEAMRSGNVPVNPAPALPGSHPNFAPGALKDSICQATQTLFPENGRLPRPDKYYTTYNPAHPRQSLGEFPRSGHADVEAAVSAAKEAFPCWAATRAATRRVAIPLRADA